MNRGGGRWLRPQSGGRKDPAKTKEIGSGRKFQIDFKLYNTPTTWKNNGVYLPKLL